MLRAGSRHTLSPKGSCSLPGPRAAGPAGGSAPSGGCTPSALRSSQWCASTPARPSANAIIVPRCWPSSKRNWRRCAPAAVPDTPSGCASYVPVAGTESICESPAPGARPSTGPGSRWPNAWTESSSCTATTILSAPKTWRWDTSSCNASSRRGGSSGTARRLPGCRRWIPGPPVDFRLSFGVREYAIEHTQIEAILGLIRAGEGYKQLIEPVIDEVSRTLPGPAVYVLHPPIDTHLGVKPVGSHRLDSGDGSLSVREEPGHGTC